MSNNKNSKSSFFINRVENPGTEFFSPAERIGESLAEKLQKDPHFYFFSPDETTSNRFTEVFETSTRAWNLKKEPWDLPESNSGHIVEMLSENILFAIMLGHLHNHESAMMGSYEAFYNVISSQIIQEIKFIKQLKAIPGKEPLPAVNLLSTSTCWRQDHNGFTHQSPALISTLLSIPTAPVNCLFPVDDVAAAAAFNFMSTTENAVNLATFNKNPLPRFIDSHHAEFQYQNSGASIYEFASDENPEIIFTAAGDIMTGEALSAIKILKSDLKNLKIRFVGINSLTPGAIGYVNNPLSQEKFNQLFPKSAPIIALFHGFPGTLNQILQNYNDGSRKISTLGFLDRGSTTTPFEMLNLNSASRFHAAIIAAKILGRPELVEKYQAEIARRHLYALENGIDLSEDQ